MLLLCSGYSGYGYPAGPGSFFSDDPYCPSCLEASLGNFSSVIEAVLLVVSTLFNNPTITLASSARSLYVNVALVFLILKSEGDNYPRNLCAAIFIRRIS